MMNQPTNLGAITERRIERVLTREGCMELALHQIIMKCDGSEMQTKRIRNIRERAKAGLDGRDPSSPGELGHVPPNHLLRAQLELSGKETEAALASASKWMAAENALSDAYLNIRQIIGAMDPPALRVPALWEYVSRCAQELVDDREALAAEVATLKNEYQCSSCNGAGRIDETLGGYGFSNPHAECPDCEGTGAVNHSCRQLRSAREEIAALRKQVQLEAQCQRASRSLPDGWDITISLEKGAGWVDLYRGDEEVELSCDCGNLASHLEAAIDHAIATAGAPS